MKTRFSSLVAALLVATTPALQAADTAPAGQGLYLIGAVGSTRYGFDCWATPFSCNGGRATAGKGVLGWRGGPWGGELVLADYGRASTASSIASRPGETIRLQAVGLALTATGRVADPWQAVARLGAMRVRHERTGELPMRTWSPSVGLGLVWQAMPVLGLELAWDMTSGEGSDSGTGVANAFTVGARLSF
jgi:hypothetical protein